MQVTGCPEELQNLIFLAGRGVGGTDEAQGLTVLISIPNDSYSHLYLRSLPLKDSEVPDLMTTYIMPRTSFSIIMNLRNIY